MAAARRITAARGLTQFSGALEILPFDAPADKTYGVLRARLEQSGKPIGANDLFIPAQALSLGHVLVADNQREFA